ncbi:flagellar hook-associated protein FlgL [Lachnospiraceae bacterium ZAX-1]
MRVTNAMITKNSMNNMNNNKIKVDYLNNQMSTQKKIARPSEDPIVAIRALRLRSDLSEINQYYEKNIPDAEAWLELTETALKNMKDSLQNIYAQCEYGATGTLTEQDRNSILQEIQASRKQFYNEGNADYAGRTIFTGYKTNSQLTFGAAEPNTSYDIMEKLSFKAIEEKNYYANQVTVPATAAEVAPGVAVGDMLEKVTNDRIRLSYAELDDVAGVKLTQTDASGAQVDLNAPGTTTPLAVTTKSYKDWAEMDDFAVDDDEVLFIPETGELIFGKNVSEGLKGDKAEINVSYTKKGFTDGEVRPEHYFDCTNTTDPDPAKHIEYKKENQEIAYMIAFQQTLVVNTQASDVFDASVGRDVDELTDTLSAAVAAYDKIATIKGMMGQAQYADEASQAKLTEWLEAANKEADYMDDEVQKLYGKYITKFQGYMTDVSVAMTDLGSKGNRLDLTKNRVANQQTTFETLKTSNEDRELSDIIIDYTSAYMAYEASLQASAKAQQQTLLNYI